MISMKKQIKQIKSILLCVLILSLLMVSGCDSKDTKRKAYVKKFEALTEIKDGQKNIYLITKVLDNNYWDIIESCVAKEAKKQGCNLYYSGSEFEAEWETQVTLLDQAMKAGADAIIIAPDDSARLAGPINEAYDKGIPVILIDTTITTENYNVCYMTDNLLAGQQAAQEMLAQLEKRGIEETENISVAIQVGSGSSQTIAERIAGFSQYWSENAPDAWEIADEVKINNGDVDYAVECANAFFKDYKNLKGVFGCNNGSTVGFAKAIAENQRTDITLVGFDYSDEVAALIEDEQYSAATMLQRQDDMARLSVSAALGLLRGGVIEEKFHDTGVVVVNQESVNTDEIQSVIHMDE